MATGTLTGPLASLDQTELQRLARVADRLFAGRPRETPGNHPHRLRAGQGIEFLDHRAYQPGDSLRDIDWLATARSRHPQVRRFRNETATDWFICLDRSASMGPLQGEKWGLAVRLSAALAYLLTHLDNRVGLILFSDRVDHIRPLGRGQRGYMGLLGLLESTTPHPLGGASLLKRCSPHIPSGCQIIVISDFLVEGGMQPDLRLLSTIGERVQAMQILEQTDLPAARSGQVSLRDRESSEQVILSLSPAARQQAEQKLRALVESLDRHCRKYHIGFSTCNASDDWKDVLLTHITNPGAARA